MLMRQAVARITRTLTGEPGMRCWESSTFSSLRVRPRDDGYPRSGQGAEHIEGLKEPNEFRKKTAYFESQIDSRDMHRTCALKHSAQLRATE